MGNHHFQWVNPLFLWSFFNSYVKLPEGTPFHPLVDQNFAYNSCHLLGLIHHLPPKSQLVRYTPIIYIWVNYNDLTATSLEIMVNKGNHPKMALIQVSEIL